MNDAIFSAENNFALASGGYEEAGSSKGIGELWGPNGAFLAGTGERSSYSQCGSEVYPKGFHVAEKPLPPLPPVPAALPLVKRRKSFDGILPVTEVARLFTLSTEVARGLAAALPEEVRTTMVEAAARKLEPEILNPQQQQQHEHVVAFTTSHPVLQFIENNVSKGGLVGVRDAAGQFVVPGRIIVDNSNTVDCIMARSTMKRLGYSPRKSKTEFLVVGAPTASSSEEVDIQLILGHGTAE